MQVSLRDCGRTLPKTRGQGKAGRVISAFHVWRFDRGLLVALYDSRKRSARVRSLVCCRPSLRYAHAREGEGEGQLVPGRDRLNSTIGDGVQHADIQDPMKRMLYFAEMWPRCARLFGAEHFQVFLNHSSFHVRARLMCIITLEKADCRPIISATVIRAPRVRSTSGAQGCNQRFSSVLRY